MKTKLAGRLPLQEAIAQTIEAARMKSKLASEEGDEKKVKKLVEYEKKEHGGKIPSVKEEEEEKKASVIDAQDPDEVEKLAAALDFVSEKLADSIENGGESRQGGEQLATMSPVGGRQNYNLGQATKKHQVPMSTGMKATKDNPGASTAVPTDDERAPGGNGAKYPPKGPFKTASVTSLQDALAAMTGIEKDAGKVGDAAKAVKDAVVSGAGKVQNFLKGRPAAYKDAGRMVREAVTGKGSIGDGSMNKMDRLKALGGAAKKVAPELGTGAALTAGGIGAKKLYDRRKSKKKAASAESLEAVDYILGKISAVENGGESKQGGEQLSNTAPVPSNPGRQLISSNSAPASATKREAKAPQKKLLKEVLTEPAQTKSTDPVVQENLRSAAKGGVKIAAATALLRKIASEGCQCNEAGTCRFCKMKSASVQYRTANSK